ncbi:DNA damage-induced cell division inhibitor SosA [Staphylococcus sp. 17KM0847]|uniref:DNA damage-induced cell division inhibitor SosA n=1 Tax=Staphylococcus sp. 17KM0847 TaxID=2583989 RepID=UPI002155BAF8|nr:DNA damage-induced cell division inhibitor SosA [Staphylococcus sp. 17KM0847]
MMLQHKLSDLHLFLIVFIASVLVFLTFFILASQNEQSEQTYEMTDHSLQDNNQIIKEKDMNREQSVFAITLRK